MNLLWIGAGGAVGSVARFLLDGWVQRLVPGSFPGGTLVVNGLGCLGMGLLASAWSGRVAVDSPLRLALVVGLLGGFTTYSSFNQQVLELLRGREAWLGVGYLLATVSVCAGAGVAGIALGRTLGGA
jgi:CrcB protein